MNTYDAPLQSKQFNQESANDIIVNIIKPMSEFYPHCNVRKRQTAIVTYRSMLAISTMIMHSTIESSKHDTTHCNVTLLTGVVRRCHRYVYTTHYRYLLLVLNNSGVHSFVRTKYLPL